MSMNKTLLFTCIVLCTALAACGPLGSSPKTLTQKDEGSTVHLKVGDILEVELEGNPTTGYTWEEAPGGCEQLSQQGQPKFEPSTNALGSGGTMTLRFKAVQQGTCALKLVYLRTFEPNIAPLSTFEATVVVGQ